MCIRDRMTPEREMQQESATREIRPKMKLIGQDGNIFACLLYTSVRLTHPPMVILTGKGRKVRQVPLMKDTCKLLDRYIPVSYTHLCSLQTRGNYTM